MSDDHTHISKQHKLALILMITFAFAIRLIGLNQAPLDYHPTRQYRFLLIARDFHQSRHIESLTAQEKLVYESNKKNLNKLEPSIMEYIASWQYSLTGSENIYFPRLLNIILWCLTAIMIYITGTRLHSASGALIAAALFLFTPYNIQASRALMPEPLMLLALVSSVWALVKFSDTRALKHLWLAAILTAITLYVKTAICSFMIFAIAVALFFYDKEQRHKQNVIRFSLFSVVALLPAVIHLLTFVKGQSKGRFFIDLLLESGFYRGLSHMIDQVYTFPLVGAFLISLCLLQDRRLKYLIAAAFLGFVVFSAYFTFHIQTHNYYQLQFVPIVCWGLMPLGQLLTEKIQANKSILINITILALLGISAKQGRLLFTQVDYSVKITKAFDTPARIDHEKKMLEEIGHHTKHSTQCLILSHAYGAPLMYHGKLSGTPWNKSLDYLVMKIKGQKGNKPSVCEQILGNERFKPEYYVVTDFRSYHREPELKSYLSQHAKLVKRSPHYLIFDLRK